MAVGRRAGGVFSDINEWTYEQYEAALVCQEPEMQNYEEDDA